MNTLNQLGPELKVCPAMYLVTITQRDGSQGRCYGLFSDAFACLLALLEEFPDAKRISARRAP